MLIAVLTNEHAMAMAHTAGAITIRRFAARVRESGVDGGTSRRPEVAYHQCRYPAPPMRMRTSRVMAIANTPSARVSIRAGLIAPCAGAGSLEDRVDRP